MGKLVSQGGLGEGLTTHAARQRLAGMGQEEHATIVDNKHGPLVFMQGSNELMMFLHCFTQLLYTS